VESQPGELRHPALYPDAGVYAFRLLGAGIDLAWLAAFVLLLSRFAPVWLLALACLPAAFVNNGTLAPGYNELGRAGLALALAGWVGGCYGWPRNRLARLLPFLGGLAFVAGTIAYLPLVVLLALPVAALVLARVVRIGWRGFGAATIAFLATVLGGYVAFILILMAAGLWSDYCRDLSWHLSIALGAMPELPAAATPASRVQEMWDAYWPSVPHVLAVLGVAWLVLTLLPKKRAWRGGSVLALLVLAGLVTLTLTKAVQLPEPPGRWNIWSGTYGLNYWLLITAIGLNVFALTLYRGTPSSALPPLPGAHEWPLIYAILLATGLTYMFAQSVFSTNRVLNAMLAVPLLLPLAVAALARTQQIRSGARWPHGALVILILWLGIVHLQQVYVWTRHDWPLEDLQTACTQPALRSIRSVRSRVDAYEGLMAYLQPRLKSGDFLYEEDDQPILYFLVRARPALPRVWSPLRRELPLAERQRMLDYMLTNQRIPQFFILNVPRRPAAPRYPRLVCEEAPPPDPIARYFRAHYFWLRSFGNLQLWARHPDVPAVNGLWRDLSPSLPRWQLTQGQGERGGEGFLLRAGPTPARVVSDAAPLNLCALGRYTFEIECMLPPDAVASFAVTLEQGPKTPLRTECAPLHDGVNYATVYPGESDCSAVPAFEVEQGSVRVRSLAIRVPVSAPTQPGPTNATPDAR
jgi:hypothetical protein